MTVRRRPICDGCCCEAWTEGCAWRVYEAVRAVMCWRAGCNVMFDVLHTALSASRVGQEESVGSVEIKQVAVKSLDASVANLRAAKEVTSRLW